MHLRNLTFLPSDKLLIRKPFGLAQASLHKNVLKEPGVRDTTICSIVP